MATNLEPGSDVRCRVTLHYLQSVVHTIIFSCRVAPGVIRFITVEGLVFPTGNCIQDLFTDEQWNSLCNALEYDWRALGSALNIASIALERIARVANHEVDFSPGECVLKKWQGTELASICVLAEALKKIGNQTALDILLKNTQERNLPQ
mmetsp:Transcript_29455/g.41462  ORF Transcript_29455/g.41462 Transcript_29455/m.41462 type:complete len:150 (-) Transcript_29455:97-546(-)